jgi:predicted transposase YbfD/YdcC
MGGVIVHRSHPNLYDSILFADIDPCGPLTPSSTHEIRAKITALLKSVDAVPTPRSIASMYKSEDWMGRASFAFVERIRTVGDHTSTERVFYISSLPANAERIARAVRSHWEIQNRLHWCLDVQVSEDQSRVRSGYPPTTWPSFATS